jgi:PKD repeat protein
VAYNSRDHEYLVVWEDYRAGDGDIYAQRYDRDGLPLQNSFAVAAWGGDQVHPNLAYNAADNEYLVVWEDTPGFGIHAQRLGAQGTPIGDSFRLFNETGVRRQPVVTYNAVDNEYLVAYVYVGLSKQVYGVLASAEGVLLHSGLHICVDDGDQDQIDLAHDPINDQYFVVWRSLEDDQGDIYARRVEADGQMTGTKFVVSAAADAQVAPAVAWNGDDAEYLVTWHDYRTSGTTGSDIYGQRFLGGSGSVHGNFLVSTSAGLDFQQNPDVVYVGDLNRYRVVWQDNREAGTLGWDLRGQWVAADGTVLGAFDAPVLRYFGDQEEPALAYGSAYHQAFAVWQDGRDGVATDVHGRLGALDLTPPRAHFTRDPAFGQAGDVFAFNAGPSRDNATPPGLLMARWDLNSDGTWDVDWSLNKYISLTIGAPNLYTVTLEIRDWAWLTDSVSYPVLVLPATQAQAPLAVPPTATLAVSPTYATAGASFSFDGSGSAGQGTLLARWDWENDGAFDTGFGPVLSASHVYTAAGTHTARLEIRDDSGLSDAALHNVTVLPASPVSLEVLPGEASLIAGQILPFRATARDTYDNLMYHPSVAWSMVDAAAGQIGASGVFTAGLQAGTYPGAVLGDAGGLQDTASITVFYPYHTYLPLLLRH